MSPEAKGQYYFTTAKNKFKIEKRPLGYTSPPNPFERVKSIVRPRKKPRQLPSIDQIAHVRGEVSLSEDASLIHDILMEDLKEKGVLEVLARETQTDPASWLDWSHDDPEKPRTPNSSVWDVTVNMPAHYSMLDPNSPSCWAAGSRRNFHWYSSELNLTASRKLTEESVSLRYTPQQMLTIEGQSSSVLDLTNSEQLALVRPILRETIENPLQSVPSHTEGRAITLL